MMGPDLLGRLLDAHAAGLTLYARQWCVAPEDAVQEAFLKLAGRSQPPPDVVGWLYAVTRNLARTAGRSRRRRVRGGVGRPRRRAGDGPAAGRGRLRFSAGGEPGA